MLIKTNYIFKGFAAFTVWPFIFIRPEQANNQGLIEHELVHYKEQREDYVIPWLLSYWLSKRFRRNAELRAYKRQIEVGGISICDAAMMLKRYGLGLTFEQAINLLVMALADDSFYDSST